MAESKVELNSFLMKVKEESEKAGLTFDRQKTKIMAFGHITSWQIDGEIMEPVADFIFLGSKTTADDDGSHAVKRHLLLGRKAMTSLDSGLKSRDITLLTKVKVKVTQPCLILCDPMDYTVHGILQARILEWVAYPFSSRSWPRHRTRVSCIADRFFTNWAIREVSIVNAMVFPVVMLDVRVGP